MAKKVPAKPAKNLAPRPRKPKLPVFKPEEFSVSGPVVREDIVEVVPDSLQDKANKIATLLGEAFPKLDKAERKSSFLTLKWPRWCYLSPALEHASADDIAKAMAEHLKEVEVKRLCTMPFPGGPGPDCVQGWNKDETIVVRGCRTAAGERWDVLYQ